LLANPIFQVSDLRVAVFDQALSIDGPPGPFTESGDQLGPGWVEVIPSVSFSVDEGESLALVGESASGKSLTLMGPFGLLSPGAKVIGGETRYRNLTYRPGGALFDPDKKRSRAERKRAGVAGTIVDDMGDTDWAKEIGTDVGFLFQNPIGSWMPVEVIGTQSGEALGYHSDLTPDEINERVYDALGEVKLPKSSRLFNAFSTELSRGMAQRAMLAAAITKAPHLLIADEPLNGLDAPVAAAIMDLIVDMRDKRDMAVVLVTHDLAAVARIADRVAVVYGGTIIEHASATATFHTPKHPYTSGLIGSIPGVGRGRLRHIEGEAPRLVDTPRDRCVFADRCEHAIDICLTTVPPLERVGDSEVACHRATELELPGVKG
jgi:oligopeptide/dipeptide ABC transporter ATP-binding protein